MSIASCALVGALRCRRLSLRLRLPLWGVHCETCRRQSGSAVRTIPSGVCKVEVRPVEIQVRSHSYTYASVLHREVSEGHHGHLSAAAEIKLMSA